MSVRLVSACDPSELIRSMPAKGGSPDSPRTEGFSGRLRNELFYGRDWAGVTLDEFIGHLDAYPRYCNEARPEEGTRLDEPPSSTAGAWAWPPRHGKTSAVPD